MLKPGDLPPTSPAPGAEPGVGDLVHRLVEDGKAYARAEVNFVKATASAKASALKLPLILFGAAFLMLSAAVTVLAVAVFYALLFALGPIASGLIAFLIFAGIAGGLGWYGAKRLSEDL